MEELNLLRWLKKYLRGDLIAMCKYLSSKKKKSGTKEHKSQWLEYEAIQL